MSQSFDSLEAEQAAMYRWMNRYMSNGFFTTLTGKYSSGMSNLEIDKHLRDAFNEDLSTRMLENLIEGQKIKSGILPRSLGEALAAYSDAIQKGMLVTEAKYSKEYIAAKDEVNKTFLELCKEISNLTRP